MQNNLKLVLLLMAFCVRPIYPSSATCTTNDTRTEVDSDTYNTTAAALKDAKVSLCGSESNYDASSGKCATYTPVSHTGGVWGTFKEICFSDNIKGSCLYKKQLGPLTKDAAFCFIAGASGDTTPPDVKYCVSGGIKCPVSKREDGNYFENRWIKRTAENNKGSGGCNGNWVGCCVKASKVDRHSKDSWWHSGQSANMTDQEKDEMDLAGSFDEQDNSVATSCISLCTSYWATLATIKESQATLDTMCVSPVACTAGDSACDCTTNLKGYWSNSTCICQGKQGAADFDSCVCTKKTPAGIWSGGHCYPSESIPLPEYGTSDNNATTSSTNTNNSSNGNGTDQTASTSSDAPLSSGLGDSGKSGAASGTANSGSSWLQQLKDSLGISSTSSGGSKLGTSKGNAQLSSTTNNSGAKNTPAQGYATKNSDLFAMVTETYTTYENRGALMGTDTVNSTGKSSSGNTKNPISTKPVIYK